MPVVGIDDLAIYVPKLYIDYKDFALARGIDPQKLEYGIGIRKDDEELRSTVITFNVTAREKMERELETAEVRRV